MVIGIVLLSKDGKYVGINGELPARPDFDKDMLLKLIKGKYCVCSPNTYEDLPKSVIKAAGTIEAIDNPWKLEMIGIMLKDDYGTAINLGIKTFKSLPPNIFYVVRSDENMVDGKDFDVKWLEDNYTTILINKNIEIYHRIS